MKDSIEQLIKLQKDQPNSMLFRQAIKFAKSAKERALNKPKLKGREFVLSCGVISDTVTYLYMVSIEGGPTEEGLNNIVSAFLADYIANKTMQEHDPKFIWSLEDEDLVNHWLMAIYFQHTDAEILYRNKVKEFLIDPPKNSKWVHQDRYDPIHFSFIKNMLASVESGQLMLVDKGSAYDAFFSEETMPSDALQLLTDIHVRRASKGKGLKDPLEYNPWTVFPLEVMSWYRVANMSGVNIELGDSYSSKFIEIPFELKITHPDYLGLLSDVSELIGFDVVKKYLG